MEYQGYLNLAQDGNPPKMAVRGLSLAVGQGECFGLLGPNGAGKSSAIHMLVGLQEPTAGCDQTPVLKLQQPVIIHHPPADKDVSSHEWRRIC